MKKLFSLIALSISLISFSQYNFAVIDVASDKLVFKEKIYLRTDALELRRNLEEQLKADPNSLPVSFALVKFHANARTVNGGFVGLAFKYATNLYRLDNYIGSLAFEYIYYKNGDLKNAETWYNNSLACRLKEGYEWRLVKDIKTPPIGVSLYGVTTNDKEKPLYETVWGSYKRRMMVPKCTGDCNYTLVSDFQKGANIVPSKLAYQNF